MPTSPADRDTRTDLLALLSFLQAVFDRTSGTLFQALAAEAGTETGFMRALVDDHVVAPCKVRIREVLRTALDEGGDPVGDLDLLAEAGPAMLTHRCLTGEATISDRYVEDVVDGVLVRLTGQAAVDRGPR